MLTDEEERSSRCCGLASLSSAEAPRGWGRWIGEKKEGALGTTRRRKGKEPLFSLSPSQRSPCAFFYPLPSLQTAYTATRERGLCGGERSGLVSRVGASFRVNLIAPFPLRWTCQRKFDYELSVVFGVLNFPHNKFQCCKFKNLLQKVESGLFCVLSQLATLKFVT